MSSNAKWLPRRKSDTVLSNHMSKGCHRTQKKRATKSSLRTLLIMDPKYRSFVQGNLPRSGTSRVLGLTTGQIRTLADLGGGAGDVEATGL